MNSVASPCATLSECNSDPIQNLIQGNPALHQLAKDDRPIYCLPQSVTVWLHHHSGITYFREHAENEIRLTQALASRRNHIGIIRKQTISTQLINTDSFLTTQQAVRDIFGDQRQSLQALAFGLLHDPGFLHEHQSLYARWQELPRWQTEPFILSKDPRRLITSFEIPPDVQLGGHCYLTSTTRREDHIACMINAWLDNYAMFLDKYELESLAYWGLPESISTLVMPGILSENRVTRTSGHSVYTHSLYSLRQRDKRLAGIEEIQTKGTASEHTDKVRFAASHQLDCSRCFLTDFLENAIRQRWPDQLRRRGDTEAILDAIAQYLQLDLCRLQSIRSRVRGAMRRNS